VPIVARRDFSEADSQNAEKVVIVSHDQPRMM